MRIRLPLYAKILGWFFLNLLLLAGLFYLFFRVQLNLGLDSLVGRAVGDRIHTAAELVQEQLAASSRTNWSGVLERFSSAYHLEFYLFRPDGVQLAGKDIQLPLEVATRLRSGPGRGGRAARGVGDGPPSWGPGRENPAREFGGRGGQPRERRAEGQGEPPPRGEFGQPGPQDLDFAPAPGVPTPPRWRVPRDPSERFAVHTSSPKGYWMAIHMPLWERGGDPRPFPATLIAMATSLSGNGLFTDFKPVLYFGFGAVLLSLLFWLPLIRGMTRSILDMTLATEAIAEGKLETRLHLERRDELGLLAGKINQMAERLQNFVTGQKRFMGDVAHELCTPIARVQMALGILDHRADARQRPYVEDVRDEMQHMSGLVNELLSFSKAGLRPKDVRLLDVSLAEVVARAVAREAKDGGELRVFVDSGLRVQAEPELLARAIGNILRNAIRHAGAAGPIEIEAKPEGAVLRLHIRDSGPGVPPESLRRLCEPFYRPEEARTRESGGVGLGLAIAKTCVEACGGTIDLQNRQPSGLEVVLTLRPPQTLA